MFEVDFERLLEERIGEAVDLHLDGGADPEKLARALDVLASVAAETAKRLRQHLRDSGHSERI